MPSGSTDPQVAPRHTTTQRRLLMVSAGIGVAMLTGVAFVLSYDDLRALALAGRAVTRYAPTYPIMYDALIVVTVLSLLVARNARWWARWTRWLLLLVLLSGAAAAGVQRAIEGYDSLPDQALVAGVAAAPHVILVIAVWLWLAMFRQARSALARRAAAPRLGPVAKVVEELPAHAAYPAGDLVPGMREATGPAEYGRPAPAEFEDAEPSVRVLNDVGEPNPVEAPEYPALPEPRYPQPRYPRPEGSGPDYPAYEERPAGIAGEPTEPDHTESDPEPEPHVVAVQAAASPPAAPSNPPSDVRLVGRPPAIRAATTRPDIVMSDALDSAEDDVDAPAIERAEDPDAGDGEPAGDMSQHWPQPAAEDHPGDPEDDSKDASDADTDTDVERWSVTAAKDVQRWADDAADTLSDDDPGLTIENPPNVEWPPSSTFRSSPTPPTG